VQLTRKVAKLMNMACLALELSLLAQMPVNEVESKLILYPYYARQAAAYDFFLDEDRKQRLLLQQQPVLNWTNADNFMGSVFLWTYGGRPELIGCIGSRQTAAGECFVFHELHSLSLGVLQPVKFGGGTRVWEPARGGIELLDVEGAPDPADSERQRLTQMRNLAREFTGWMKQDGDVTELRLLPQPIFRYQALGQDVIDGALFALVWKGTDPDILLMLENREVRGKQRWQYALARFNWREMWVQRNDKEVWRVAMSGLSNNHIYISGRVTQTTLSTIGKVASEE
jgi:hypothetical protein